MARIIEGVAMIAGAILLSVVTAGAFAAGAIGMTLASGLFDAAVAVGLGGISITLSGIAAALRPGLSMPFSMRQPNAPRQIVYGQARVAGIIVYMSTTNNGHDLNQVIAWACHSCQSVDTVYIDGRAAHIPAGGGQDNGGTYYDDSGNSYTFGSLVTIWHSLGQVPAAWFSDLGSRDSNWTSDCRLDGITSSYVRTHFDQNTFSGLPGIKANIHGKNTIFDPRTQPYGYTNHAALINADFHSNNEYGLGCNYTTEIDQAQLIAAANICDQPVTLADGNVEARYTINGFFDTSSTPGDILDAMLMACEGRIAYSGGTWKIYPAAWYGSGVSFTQDDFAGPVKWLPKRKYRDLVNAVRGTFVSPKYPYAIVGYDQDHKDPNIWSGEWQPTDFPEYAQDSIHGYPSDANLAADGNIKLYTDRGYRFVTSVATAQRLAKIYLLRNRQQGSGTLLMKLSALQVQAQDVIQVTFPALGWVNKYLEVQAFRFVPKMDANQKEGDGPALYCELDVVETDPSVYLWSAAEELGPQNTASPVLWRSQQVNPPTNLTLESGADSAVLGADGVVIPRIHVSWIVPDDPWVLSGGYINLQWTRITAGGDAGVWHSEGHISPNITDHFIAGVITGYQYIIQIQAIRSNGAASGWMQAGPHTVSSTASTFSYQNVSGLGSLATKNFVDFSTGDVANKAASNLNYSNGLSVEALRPAEPNAQQVAGKSIDILADGTVYARVKASQTQGGAIVGMSYGHNIVPNNGFELNFSNSALGDGWTIGEETTPASFFYVTRDTGGGNSGAASLLIGVNSNQPYPNNCNYRVRVFSPKIPVQGNQQFFYGGSYIYYSYASAPGLTVTLHIGLMFFDANGNYLYEQAQLITSSTGGAFWQTSGYATAPSNAVSVAFECGLFAVSTQAGTTPSQPPCWCHFDDVFCAIQLNSSGLLNSQGSIMPNQPVIINYSATSTGITFSWAAQSVLRGDGSTLNIPAGNKSYSSLASSTTYYTYWYIRVSDGTLQVTNGSPPPTSPSSVLATQTGLDGRIPAAVISVATLASGSGGSSGGTGGGGDRCPEAAELVEVRDKGQIPAGSVEAGDYIKGRSFQTGEDVFRRVLQVHSQTCAAWRIVEGHRVSPCEPVYHEGEWKAAYRAPSTVDTSKGRKMLITVESDEYDEMNYYLVSGTVLLIHNAVPIMPC